MSSEQILIHEEKKRISKTGGTAAIYLPKETKEFISIGDLVEFSAKVEGNKIIIIISKSLFNFGLKEIKNLLHECNFKTKKEETIGDVKIFQAKKEDLSLSYTKNMFESKSPSYITMTKNFFNLDYTRYNNLLEKARELKGKFDIITRPEGDLDTIKILKDPKFHKMDMKKAFSLLKKSKKKIGLSITIRFNNKKNSLNEIRSAIESLK